MTEPTATGTIDVTELVAQIQDVWVKWATGFVVTSALTVPWLAWLGLPVIAPLFRLLVGKIVTALAESAEMEAFYLNTSLKKASQAQDFIDATEHLDTLPVTATQEEIKNAEANRMAAFRNFVLLDN